MRRIVFRSTFAVFASALAACDDQVSPEYGGEPLVTVRGTVLLSDGATAPSGARAALLFEGASTSSSNAAGNCPSARTDVAASRPTFVSKPPPPSKSSAAAARGVRG
jgi:hypothetical protein